METIKLTVDVSKFSDVHEYLQSVYAERKRLNAHFSYRAWARILGIRSHALLAMMVGGSRRVNPKYVPAFVTDLRFDRDEARKFIRLVAETDREREAKRVSGAALEREKLEASVYYLDKFHLVSEWIHFAILEMSAKESFCDDPKWICRNLEFAVSVVSVRRAIRRMIELGLLKREGDRLIKTHRYLDSVVDVPSEGVRMYHKSVCDLAKEAIDKQDIREREYVSFSFNLDPEKLGQAKEAIRRFKKAFERRFEVTGDGDTYQMGIQLFRLSKPKNKRRGDDVYGHA